MTVSTFPSPDTTLPCVSQWGRMERNDAVVMRRRGTAPLEVFLTEAPHPRDWAREGYRSREEYLFWSPLACLFDRSPRDRSTLLIVAGAAVFVLAVGLAAVLLLHSQLR
jgi:hypothetical protein